MEEEKYVKFTEGIGKDLIRNKPYPATPEPSPVLWKIVNERGITNLILVSEKQGCAHIGFSHWHLCDKNGNLI